jgi:ABC-type transporter Mla maintaining outer membrane lipid asymmetry permease subunit MlaE
MPQKLADRHRATTHAQTDAAGGDAMMPTSMMTTIVGVAVACHTLTALERQTGAAKDLPSTPNPRKTRM